MKHLKLIPILAPLAFAACVPLDPPTCGLPNEAVVIGQSKSGFPIYDDQMPLSVPCVVVTPPNVSTPPVIVPPVLPPVEPPVEPPTEEPKWRNNGFGSGDQDAPGRSEVRNHAENSGGTRNGTAHRPGNSGHGEGQIFR